MTMTPEHWQRVKELLGKALELNPTERPRFLDQACGSDRSLRDDVQRFLAAEEKAGPRFLSSIDVLAAPGQILAAQEEDQRNDWRIGQLLGRYKLVSLIGEGGMGEVYRAVRADNEYESEVAVKLVQAGRDSPSVISRFRNERQILAGLDHPNIARLHDGGTTPEGVPYFVMELIEGEPIDEYCDHHKLGIDERLTLFLDVCSAVEYAHRRLIVHRDIKPSNILVTSDGIPKLLDFGIAKIVDPSNSENVHETAMSLRVFSPAYASPEQVKGEPITTASDLYSLGVLLYELLTGHRPYPAAARTSESLARAICEHSPEKLSTVVQRAEAVRDRTQNITPESVSTVRECSPEKLRRRLSGDLDNIVLMALRKEPERRYGSVAQLAEDIRHHLKNLPVAAHADALGYRSWKFVKRHKVGIASAVVTTVALIAGTVVSVHQARIARAQKALAEMRFNDVRKLSNSLIFEIHDSIQNLPGATPARKLLLERAREYLDGLAKESNGDLALQRDLAAAYLRVGSLQGITFDANTGEIEAAITSLQKAASIADMVAKASPGNVDDQLTAARVHAQLSSVLGNTGRAGDREEIEKAIAITTRLLSIDGSNPKVLAQHALGYDRFAFFQEDAGDVQGAAESLKKALGIGEGLLKSAPEDKKEQNRVAVARVRLGNELVMLGLRREALDYNSAGLHLYEALVQDSTNARARREMAVTLNFRGNIQMMDGDAAGAFASYQRSLEMIQELVRADPKNALYHLDAAGANAAMGRALASTGKAREGLAMLEKAIAAFQESYAENPSYTDIPYWLGQVHIWKGEILEKADARGALNEYLAGVSSLEKLLKVTPSVGTRCDLASGYTKVAGMLALTGDHQQAAAVYSKALNMVEPLASANPPNMTALYAAADAYFGMGELVNRTRQSVSGPGHGKTQLGEACEWYRKSADAWRQIPNPGRRTPSGFVTGDPDVVANKLRACEAISLDRGR